MYVIRLSLLFMGLMLSFLQCNCHRYWRRRHHHHHHRCHPRRRWHRLERMNSNWINIIIWCTFPQCKVTTTTTTITHFCNACVLHVHVSNSKWYFFYTHINKSIECFLFSNKSTIQLKGKKFLSIQFLYAITNNGIARSIKHQHINNTPTESTPKPPQMVMRWTVFRLCVWVFFELVSLN